MIYDYAPRLATRRRVRQQQRHRQFWLLLGALVLTSLSFNPVVPEARAASTLAATP